MAESLRDIRLFVAVYEERSFTAAALREHSTQSGVSQHIQKMEGRLGVTLFSRGTGAVNPTPAGDAYYRGCIEVLRAHENAGRAVRRFANGIAGEIAVGLTPTMTRSILAPALARFIDTHPNVNVRIVDAYSDFVMQQVRGGELAFAIVPAGLGAPGVNTKQFAATREFFVSRGNSGLQHLAPVNLADLRPQKMIVPSVSHARRSALEHYFALTGVNIERRLELDTMLGTLDLVAKSDWVTLLPATVVLEELEQRRFTVNPLVPSLTLELILVEPSQRDLEPAASAFLEMLRSETAELHACVDKLVVKRGRTGAGIRAV